MRGNKPPETRLTTPLTQLPQLPSDTWQNLFSGGVVTHEDGSKTLHLGGAYQRLSYMYNPERGSRHASAQTVLNFMYDYGARLINLGLAYSPDAKQDLSQTLNEVISHARFHANSEKTSASESIAPANTTSPNPGQTQVLMDFYNHLPATSFKRGSQEQENVLQAGFPIFVALDHLPAEMVWEWNKTLALQNLMMTSGTGAMKFPNNSSFYNDSATSMLLDMYINNHYDRFKHIPEAKESMDRSRRTPQHYKEHGQVEMEKMMGEMKSLQGRLEKALKSDQQKAISMEKSASASPALKSGYEDVTEKTQTSAAHPRGDVKEPAEGNELAEIDEFNDIDDTPAAAVGANSSSTPPQDVTLSTTSKDVDIKAPKVEYSKEEELADLCQKHYKQLQANQSFSRFRSNFFSQYKTYEEIQKQINNDPEGILSKAMDLAKNDYAKRH